MVDKFEGELYQIKCPRKLDMSRGVSRIFIMGFPPVRNYRNIFGISSDQVLTI